MKMMTKFVKSIKLIFLMRSTQLNMEVMCSISNLQFLPIKEEVSDNL